MPDLIKGVDVLDDRIPGAEVLFIVCVAESPTKSKPFIGRINVRRQGTPETAKPQWQYVETGDLLAVTPSVRCSTTVPIEGSAENREVELFHNAGAWTVPFVRWSAANLPEENGDDATSRWGYCHRLNQAILSPL